MPGDKLWSYFGPYFGLIAHKHKDPAQVGECQLCIKWIGTRSPDETEKIKRTRTRKKKEKIDYKRIVDNFGGSEVDNWEKAIGKSGFTKEERESLEKYRKELEDEKSKKEEIEKAFNEFVTRGKLQDFPCKSSKNGDHDWEFVHTLSGFPQEICKNCGATRLMGGQQLPDISL